MIHTIRRTIPCAALAAAATAFLLLATPASARGQAVPDSVRAELDRLRARIDSLEALVRRIEAEGEAAPAAEAADELEALRAAAQAAAGQEPADTAAGPEAQAPFQGRQRSLQALNPEISVTGDFFGHMNTDDVDEDPFVMREVEFAFQSTLDPYSRAKIFGSVHGTGPELVPFGELEHGHAHGEEGEEEGGGVFAIEEAYLEWVGLPGGLSLKLGQFFQRFGQLNRWHAHALPFQSRSLPHLAFIGEEPLGQAGASVSTLLPFLPGGAYEATVEVTRSSNELLFGEAAEPSVLGHLNAFWQLTPSTDLDLGLSWLHGDFADEEHRFGRDLQGVEAAFTWRPPQRARYRELTVRGGVMRLDGLVPHEEESEEEPGHEEEHLEAGDGNALGAWSLAELRLSPRWIVGARFDWTENPEEPEESAWLLSPTLTWWQSEWVRIRLEYDLLGRSALADDESRLWLWASFAMGPHKHETY
ncbi:MAG: hypothetical protein KY453_01565 [Gemmatimonadetes bacterium]|nr:hypothetical protein [Gemmatimonadota bacterium]